MDLIARGNTAEIIAQNDSLICKLFNLGYPKTYIEHELDNAQAIFYLGIRTPKAYNLVCVDDRFGIIYDRIFGETLSSKIATTNEEELIFWMQRFTSFHKNLLLKNIDNVIDYKDFLKIFASNSEAVISKINALDDGNCLLHGDFHPGNIMVDDNNHFILIDMMNICKGSPKYDIARTYFLLENNKKLQNMYLELMGYELKDLMPYLEVISLMRENETKL